jgi:hypothetical protein
MSSWYTHAQPEIGVTVPAKFFPLYKGVNTGTMFMNLKLMRKLDWTKIWTGELQSGRFSTKTYLTVRFSPSNTKLGDQNIVNAIGIHSPELIGFIGYEWNFQDHDRSDAAPGRRLALAMFSNINILHGNNAYFSTNISSVMQLAWCMVGYLP